MRLSTVLPRACSGLMYAAVPRIIPTPVIMAGVVIVGDCDTLGDTTPAGSIAFASPKSKHLHGAVGPHLDVRGLEIAMDDPLLVRRFEGLGNLLRDGQGFVDGDRAAGDPLRQVLALDEFHDESAARRSILRGRGCAAMLGWFSDASVCASRVNRASRSGSLANESGRTFSATSRFSFVSRARYTCAHAAFANLGGDFVDAEAGAGSEGQLWRDYTGVAAVPTGLVLV